MLYNVRYEIAVSEMMDYNMDDLAAFICEEFQKEEDADNAGFITGGETGLISIC